MFVYELSDYGLESRCSHLNYIGVDITPSDFIEKETPVQVFSYEFCKIFQHSNFLEHLWTTATIEELIAFQINIFPIAQMEKFPVTHFRSFLQSCSG